MGLTERKQGIVVIHGKESTFKRGEFLAGITNHLANALLESPVKYPLNEVKPWEMNTDYKMGDLVCDSPGSNLRFRCVVGGKSAKKPPWWKILGIVRIWMLISDGNVRWKYETDRNKKKYELRYPDIKITTDIPFNSTKAGKVTMEITPPKDRYDTTWEPEKQYFRHDFVTPTDSKGLRYECIQEGFSGEDTPIWPGKASYIVHDNKVLWKGIVDNINAGTEKGTWVFKEAFWDDASLPSPAGSVVSWLLKSARNQIWYMFQGIFLDPSHSYSFQPSEKHKGNRHNSFWGELLRLASWLWEFIFGFLFRPFWNYIKTHFRRWQKDKEYFHAWQNKFTYLLLDELLYRIVFCFLLPVFFVLAIIAPILMFIVWVLYKTPAVGFASALLKWNIKIDPLILAFMGDPYQYLYHEIWAANIRRVVTETVAELLKNESVNDLVLIVKSFGVPVVYEILAEGGELAATISDLNFNGKITVVAVGSALNHAMKLSRRMNVAPRQRFTKPLDRRLFENGNFYWLELYSRFDPVPAGDLDKEVIAQLGIPDSKIKQRRVVNLDNPITDHDFYFPNKYEVVPRIARAINGGEYPWAEAGITEEKLRYHKTRVPLFFIFQIRCTWHLNLADCVFFL